MKNKQKLIVAVLIFIVGTVANIYFSTILHLALSRHLQGSPPPTLYRCLHSIVTNQKHLVLFLCLTCFVLLAAVFYYLANNKPYQSQLRQITSNISTPVPVGQKQYGSAEWLTEAEKEKYFKSFYLDSKNPLVKELINRGYEDIEDNVMDISPIAEGKQKLLPVGGPMLELNKSGTIEKIYFIEDDTHTLCLGATGSGKTRTFVLQSIGIMALAGESMIISDPKGELYQYSNPFLERLGYEVFAIDYKNPTKSNRYNYLQPIINTVDTGDVARAIDATWDLTSTLVGEAKGERIWNDGESSIIAAAIMCVVFDNKDQPNRKYQNMTNVYFFIAEMCKPIDNKLPIVEYVKKLPDNHPAKGLLAISEIAPSRTRGSFFTAALTTLRLFTNPMIYSMTKESEFDMLDTGKKKRAIFIILPDEKTTYYSLASLFVDQQYMMLVNAADRRGGRLENRANFMLEEFGNFTKIPDFGNKLTVGRGRGIRFIPIIQSFAQLEEKYGREGSRIVKGNCEIWVYLQTDDLETLKELSDKLGNYTVSTYSLSSSHGKYTTPSSSHSINLMGRALMTVEEIKRILRPYSLIYSKYNPAIMYAPDLSQMAFNKMFGLGDKEHNRVVRELRESRRHERNIDFNEMDLWGIWKLFTKKLKEQAFYENVGLGQTRSRYPNKPVVMPGDFFPQQDE